MRKPPQTGNRLNPFMVLVIGLASGLVLGYLGRPMVTPVRVATMNATPISEARPAIETAGPPQETKEPSPGPTGNVPFSVRHFKGDASAPVTIVEFSDFQCPFCGRFTRETAPLIEETYIQSGKVRFGYVHFAFLGPESLWAAQAAECAADQNSFWAYHDLLFQRQAGENQGAFNKENLKVFAEELGLDTTAFNECLDSGKYAEVVAADASLARSLGISVTPTFWINGQMLVGALPFDAFAGAINNAIASPR